MSNPIFNSSPATLAWRAFFFLTALLLALAAASPAQAQGGGKRVRPQANYAQIGEPDQAEGAKLLADLRTMGIPGDYYLSFQLVMMPRRGEEKTYVGRMWGGRRAAGTLTRLELRDAEGFLTRLLVLTGPSSHVWQWNPTDEAPRRLPTAELFSPLGKTLFTPFDIQMPYIHWLDSTYEGIAKVRGRPTHRFLMYPPGDIALANPEISGVRVCMDTQYKALIESIILGTEGKPAKRMELVELKKVGEQYIVRTVEVLDEVTRSKSRLEVTAAALGLDFSDQLFAPDSLREDVRPPEHPQLTRF